MLLDTDECVLLFMCCVDVIGRKLHYWKAYAFAYRIEWELLQKLC